jgi:Na+/phosphate symporter
MTSVPADLPAQGGVRDGVRDLSEATAGLGRARREIPIGRVLFVGGGALVALGVVAILLGWYGTAHTTRIYKQIPYMVSGGLLGLAFVMFGGFAYFGYWLTRLLEDERRSAATLERIEALLQETATASATAAAVSAAAPAGAVAEVVATPTGNMAHRPDCSMVAGKRNLVAVDPDTTDLAPCRICQPF